MIDHIAHLAGFDWASVATQKLVSPARLPVDHEALRETHVAGIGAESVSDASMFHDGLLERAVIAFLSIISLLDVASHHSLAWIQGL